MTLDQRIRFAWGCIYFRHAPAGPACAVAGDRHCGLLQYPRSGCPLEDVGDGAAWKAALPLAEGRP